MSSSGLHMHTYESLYTDMHIQYTQQTGKQKNRLSL